METAERPSIDGLSKLIGLLGRGISHTLSPAIHNATISLLGLNSVYVPFDIQGPFPELAFFQSMWDAGALGFNITVPFKEEAARLFASDSLSINTLFRGPQGWLATSTDGPGFLRGLNQLNLQLQNFEAIIILGNGGAAKALHKTFHLAAPELPQFVLRRSSMHDSAWKSRSLSPPALLPFEPRFLQELLMSHPRSLLIQSTSAPLRGDRLESFASVIDGLEGAFVDLVYGAPSALLERAQRQGLPSQDGIPMLIGQALLAQELWWGQSAAFTYLEGLLRQRLRTSAQ